MGWRYSSRNPIPLRAACFFCKARQPSLKATNNVCRWNPTSTKDWQRHPSRHACSGHEGPHSPQGGASAGAEASAGADAHGGADARASTDAHAGAAARANAAARSGAAARASAAVAGAGAARGTGAALRNSRSG